MRIFCQHLSLGDQRWDVNGVGDEVADGNRDEGQCKLLSSECSTPLLVDRVKGLEESEDEGVTEPREERTAQHDRLPHKHVEGSNPGLEHLFFGESVLSELGRAVNVLLSSCSPPFGLSVEEDTRTGFRNEEEMEDLDETSENELNPSNPFPAMLSAGVHRA